MSVDVGEERSSALLWRGDRYTARPQPAGSVVRTGREPVRQSHGADSALALHLRDASVRAHRRLGYADHGVRGSALGPTAANRRRTRFSVLVVVRRTLGRCAAHGEDADLSTLAFADTPTDRPSTSDSTSSSAYSDHSTEYLGTTPTAAPATAVAPEPEVRTETVEVPARRGSTDLGLFVLRVTIGAVFLGHGLQKLVGLWDGPGLDGFQNLLESSGFRYSEILAIAAAAGETLGGALLILGLATPLAGAAVLATIINAWCFKQAVEPGLQFSGTGGVEYETVLGFAAAAIILTGPGRIAFDGRRGWATRPRIGSFLALAVGIAAGVCIWIFLNGANPVVR